MVNDTACQKQEAPNQKCKPKVSKTNLIFFTKKSYIIYQSYKLKVWGRSPFTFGQLS